MVKDIVIPDIGEKVETGMVVSVLVSVGDMVKVDQPLVEIETDKAVVEIPSTEEGRVVEITVKEGEEVKPGHVIARIETEAEGKVEKAEAENDIRPETEKKEEDGIEAEKPGEKTIGEKAVAKEEQPVTDEKEPEQTKSVAPHIPAPAAPSVRRLARELGADINQISGTGPGGRISADDIKKYVKATMTGIIKVADKISTAPQLPDFSQWGEIRRESFSTVRRLTAENIGYAWQVVPHVTQFDRADITALEEFRNKYSSAVDKLGGKLTVTIIIMKVIVAALQRFPRFNASIDMERKEIIYKNHYNIAVAVDTDRGLLVPVIRNVDKKSIAEIAVELTDLAERTRNKKVRLEELEGGTFTISNQGGIGGTNFTPIVFWPQVAILGVSRSSVQQKYMNDKFEPRLILPLSLSYDHRIIDGADAARFLHWVVEALEHPLLLNLDGLQLGGNDDG